MWLIHILGLINVIKIKINNMSSPDSKDIYWFNPIQAGLFW